MALLYDESVSCAINYLDHAMRAFEACMAGNERRESLEVQMETFWLMKLEEVTLAANGEGPAYCPACGQDFELAPLECSVCYSQLIAD